MENKKLLEDYILFHYNQGNISDYQQCMMEQAAADYLLQLENNELKFKVDEKVMIIGNEVNHGFEIGQEVIIKEALLQNSNGYVAEDLKGRECWCIMESDIKAID